MKIGEKSFVTGKGAGSILASADYHGSEVTVVRSRCVGMVGLAGIVVRDTQFTFQIITKKNELKSKTQVLTENCHGTNEVDCSSYTKKTYNISLRDTTTWTKPKLEQGRGC